jgi:hypothetical protein
MVHARVVLYFCERQTPDLGSSLEQAQPVPAGPGRVGSVGFERCDLDYGKARPRLDQSGPENMIGL